MKIFKSDEGYERILDVKSAAKILGVSTSYVYKMADEERIDCIKYPNALRFYESDILDYLKKHRVEAKCRLVK